MVGFFAVLIDIYYLCVVELVFYFFYLFYMRQPLFVRMGACFMGGCGHDCCPLNIIIVKCILALRLIHRRLRSLRCGCLKKVLAEMKNSV